MPLGNPDSLKSTKTPSLKGIAFAVARHAGTGKLYFGSSDFKVYAVDPAAPKFEPKELGAHESYVTSVALCGKTLVSGGYDCKLVRWDVDSGKQIGVTEDAHAKWIRNLVASPDGKTFASVGDDMVCRVWDAATGKKVHELRGHKEKTPTHFPSMLFNATYSADGKHLATCDKVGTVIVWEAATGKKAAELEVPGLYTWDGKHRIHSIGGVRGLAFSPDGKKIAAGGIGHIGNVDHLDGPARVEVFDWAAGKKTHEFFKTKHKGIVNRLAFHPKGDWLVAAGGAGNGFVIFFDLAGNKVRKEENVKFHVHGLTLSDDASSMWLVGHNGAAEYEMK